MSSATLDDVMAELRLMRTEFGERMSALEQRQASVEKSVDGFDRYVRNAVKGDHLDTEHAEREADKALEQLAELELENVHHLEAHERCVRRGGGE